MMQRISLFTLIILLMTLYSNVPAVKLASQSTTSLQQVAFSGYVWDIRQTEEPEGPLNNYFGGRGLAVFLEPGGALKLSVAYKDGIWYASEVYLRKRLGYGTYLFRLATPMGDLDRNLVLGLFTYSNSKAYTHREIDIEFSSWGQKNEDPKGQFVVQPSEREGNMYLFPLDRFKSESSFLFDWKPDRIEFAAWNGAGNRPIAGDPSVLASWTFTDVKAIPKPGNESVHLNFYLAKGGPAPYGTGLSSVNISAFEFTPMKK